MTRLIILALCIIVGAGVLFTNIYTSLVDTVNWNSNPPASLITAREYFKAANPGAFFRIFSPLNQLLAFILVIACWKAGPAIRWTCVAALLFALAGDGLTFKYFYPRNDIMFVNTPMDAAAATKALKEWMSMNWVRTLIVIGEVVAYIRVLILLFKAHQADG